MANLQKLTPFKTPANNHQIDSFQDCMFICSTKIFKLTPFKTPALDYIVFLFSMGDTLQIDRVKSPWETNFNKTGCSFKTILHSKFWTHFKTPVNHTSHISEWTPFKTIQKRKRTQRTWQYSFSDFLDSFQDPAKTQDTGQPDRSFIIHHHTIEGM